MENLENYLDNISKDLGFNLKEYFFGKDALTIDQFKINEKYSKKKAKDILKSIYNNNDDDFDDDEDFDDEDFDDEDFDEEENEEEAFNENISSLISDFCEDDPTNHIKDEYITYDPNSKNAKLEDRLIDEEILNCNIAAAIIYNNLLKAINDHKDILTFSSDEFEFYFNKISLDYIFKDLFNLCFDYIIKFIFPKDVNYFKENFEELLLNYCNK